MKDATGEGSMTIITIVMIVALAAAAAIIIGIVANNAKSGANNANSDYECSEDASGKITCSKKTNTQTTNP